MTPDSPADLPSAVLAERCHLRIPSKPSWIAATIDYLMARAGHSGAVHPSRAMKVMLALNEALTNSIIHGNLGISSKLKEESDRAFARAVAARCSDPEYAMRPVDIQVNYDGQKTQWVFGDQGEGFDFQTVLTRLEEGQLDPLRPSGRGLLMMRAFLDEVRYEEGGRRAILTLHQDSEEKRSQPRWSINRRVGVAPIDDQGRVHWEASREVVGRHLSSGGIDFLGVGLVPAERVGLTISLGEQLVQVQAEVRHWRALEGNVVEVGCRFETPLTVTEREQPASACDALGRLVARLTEQQKPHEERRSSVRVPYSDCVEIELSSGEVLRGFGRDLSHGGIGFLAPRNLINQTVGLRLPGEQGPLLMRARVVRSTRLVDDFHDVAAQFVSG